MIIKNNKRCSNENKALNEAKINEELLKVNFVVLLFLYFCARKSEFFMQSMMEDVTMLIKLIFLGKFRCKKKLTFCHLQMQKRHGKKFKGINLLLNGIIRLAFDVCVFFKKSVSYHFIILEIIILEGSFFEYNVALILWWENGFIEILNRLVMRATGSVTQAAATVKNC